MTYRTVLPFCLLMLGLNGCPFWKPTGHSRPLGHGDVTVDIAPQEDVILFNATGTGGRDLYLLRLADMTVTRIAETEAYETDPRFSPDGQQIVYAAGIPGDRADHLFLIQRDGSNRRQLTSGDTNDTDPQFSPDGSQIVFARDKNYRWGGLASNWSGGGAICVIGADGRGERQLTSDEQFAMFPHFLPDGKTVVYATHAGIFEVPVDGSASPSVLRRWTLDQFASVELSPDGRQVAYARGKFSPDVEIFLAELDGSNVVQVTQSNRGCYRPVFSPSGQQIFYMLEEWPQGPTGKSKSSLWSIKTDGTGLTPIAHWTLFDSPLTWKPPTMSAPSAQPVSPDKD